MTFRNAWTECLCLVTLFGLPACSDSDAGAKGGATEDDGGGAGGDPDAAPAYRSEIYSDETKWLCLPGKTGDLCRENLDATVLHADGTMEVEPHVFAESPAVDCFYVYPTISADETANSDFEPAETAEINVVREQAARLSRVCDVYAPIYRQVTLGSLFGTVQSDVPLDERRNLAYADVLDAWKHYLANHNEGRPFLLAGHSQGTGMLRRLIQEEIDEVPALRERLVSAFLIGGDITVPAGADVGGDFQNVPLCRAPADTGCVVAYASFRSDAPPPANSRFGKSRSGSGLAACTHPSALGGGSAYLTPYFKATAGVVGVTGAPAVTTPYVTLPEFLRGECVFENDFSFLKITVEGKPADPRPDDVSGDLTPDWGLHLADMHLTMGDLTALAEAQVAALGAAR